MISVSIFGSVSSGKSTFINALFGSNIAKTGDGITTDKATSYKYNNIEIIDLPGINEDVTDGSLFIEKYKKYLVKSDFMFCIFDKSSAFTMKKLYNIISKDRDDIYTTYFILNKIDNIDDIDEVVKGIEDTVDCRNIVMISSRLAYSANQYNSNQLTSENENFLKKYLFTKKLDKYLVNKAYYESNFNEIKILLSHIEEQYRNKIHKIFTDIIEDNNIIPNHILFNLYDFRQTSICSFKDKNLELLINNLKYINNNNDINRYQLEFIIALLNKFYIKKNIFNYNYVYEGTDSTFIKYRNDYYKVFIEYKATNTSYINVSNIIGYKKIIVK